MPNLDFDIEHFLRSKGGYKPFTKNGFKFKKSFFPYHSELWNSLPKYIQSTNLIDLKEFTKKKWNQKDINK